MFWKKKNASKKVDSLIAAVSPHEVSRIKSEVEILRRDVERLREDKARMWKVILCPGHAMTVCTPLNVMPLGFEFQCVSCGLKRFYHITELPPDLRKQCEELGLLSKENPDE